MKKLSIAALLLLSGCVYSSAHPRQPKKEKCTSVQLCAPSEGNKSEWYCFSSTEYRGNPPICKEDSKKKK